MVKDEIAKCWSGRIFWDLTMAELSTLRVGGPVEAVIYPESESELCSIISSLCKTAIPWRVIGRGSNILASDDGVAGVIIVLGRKFAGIKTLGGRQILVEAGCSLAKLTYWCGDHGLSGLEFAMGIPGSLGGAVRMNAGAWGRAMVDVVKAVRLVNQQGECREYQVCAGDFTYRNWLGAPGEVIIAAILTLQEDRPEKILALGRKFLEQRRGKQPKGMPSAGSFFKNPSAGAAGDLIERAGLKGHKIGGAMVSEVHANFLVNTGSAKAQDFFDLMEVVKNRVREKFAVILEPEVEII